MLYFTLFSTILHRLKSPQNVGAIIRSHVAFGGGPVVFVGDEPWRFRKSSQAFSRRLERLAELIFVPDDDQLLDWCEQHGFSPVAIEIDQDAISLKDFRFPRQSALVVGNEGTGLPEPFLRRCAGIVTIPQYGSAECLNVGVSASIAMYELVRTMPRANAIEGAKFCVAGRS
jgi:23S rRNA (guanosine2251-2'-O)-methyltransferase